MLRQIIIIVVSAAIIAVSIFFSRRLSQRPEAARPPAPALTAEQMLRPVQTLSVRNEARKTDVALYGRLAAYEKTDLYSEVQGMSLPGSPVLRPGKQFVKGEVLVQIDNHEQELALKAQRSTLLTTITQMMPDLKTDFGDSWQQWDEYRSRFDLDAPTPELPKAKSERERNYVSLKNIYNQYYTIKSTEERLSKYVLHAPFSGEITQSFINTGSYIRAGQPLATLMNTSEYELEASLHLSDLQHVRTGASVRLQSEDVAGEWTGTVHRIGSTIDTKTQTVKLYIKVSGKNLRENMFLSGSIQANSIANAFEISRNLLQDDEQVFVVRPDSTLALESVQVLQRNDKTVLVRGLKDGEVLLNESLTGVYAGMKVAPVGN